MLAYTEEKKVYKDFMYIEGMPRIKIMCRFISVEKTPTSASGE